MLKRGFIGLLIVLLFAVLLPVQAQTDSPDLPLAVISSDNQIVLYGFSDTPSIVQTPPANSYSSLGWSPDGSTLAFMLTEPNYNHSIMIYTPGQPGATQLINQTIMGLPISFTADGSQIVYTAPTDRTAADMMGSIYEVRAIAPVAGSVPVTLGEFAFGVGCGGGSSFPGDWLYWTETAGFGGNLLLLSLTPFGVVHNINCTGQGINLLDLASGTDVVLDGTLSRAVVSPDRTQVAGVSNDGGLSLINLQTREVIALPAAAIPDQITWGAPGSGTIFYSTRTDTGQQIVVDEAQRLRVAQALGYMDTTMLNIPIMDITIHRYNLNDNTDTQIYANQTYAIGRMIATPDGSTLLFSEIPGMQAWVQGILDGSINPIAESSYEQVMFVTLYSLNLTDNSVSAVGSNLHQAALNGAVVSQ